jgi:hypothetical protein
MTDELEAYMVDFDIEIFAKKMVETLNETQEWDFEKFTQPFTPKRIVDRYKELYLH